MVQRFKNEHIDIFFVYGISVCLVIILSIVHFFSTPVSKTLQPKDQSIEVSTVPLFDSSLFSTVVISGKAYVVYDLMTHTVIASKNESTVLPLASITKLMMAITATLHKPKNTQVTVTSKSIEDGYDLGLKNKQTWSLNELLKYILIFSSNDGAEIVADNFGGKDAFIHQMNQDAHALGLKLVFTDPAGRDLAGQIGGKGSALDAAKLFDIARKNFPEVLDSTTKKRGTVLSSTGKISGVPNTNQDIENISGAEASKTGFTDMAGGNLGVIVDVTVGHPVAIVVLGSTKEGRFKDIDILYQTLRKSVTSNKKIGL